jgi:hypothetical protein
VQSTGQHALDDIKADSSRPAVSNLTSGSSESLAKTSAAARRTVNMGGQQVRFLHRYATWRAPALPT